MEAIILSNEVMEVILSASLAINLSVVFYVGFPWLFNLCSKNKEVHLNRQSTAFFNRMSSSVPFYVGFPVCSIVLTFTSGVLYNPFSAYDRPLRIVFSAALGQYIYKIAESLYWNKFINYKSIVIHHSVVIAIFVVVLHYKQCAVMGLVGLLLNGSFVFAEFDNEKLSKGLKERISSMKLLLISSAVFILSVVLKGLVPGFLILYTVAAHSGQLLQVEYVPLGFFFLSLVFFSAVSGWFMKDAFYCLKDMLHCEKHKELVKVQRPMTPINHKGLVQLIEHSNGAAFVRYNDLWERDFNETLCTDAHALQSKKHNSNVIEIESETSPIITTTNILTSQSKDS